MGLAGVKADMIPLYEKPSVSAKMADEVLYGMSVQIVQQSETGWSYIRTEYGMEGYTPTTGLQEDEQIATAWRNYKKQTVLAPYIDIMAESSATSARITSLPRGGILVALGNPGLDGWQKVGLVDGSVGFTASSYIGEVIEDWRKLSEEDTRWNIVETALSYNGAALRIGGRTPLGIDSIGLVVMSYAMNGIQLPHKDLSEPCGDLHPIKKSQMDEGDVLFFENSLGIYMGENRFVHATDTVGSEGVVVSSLKPKDEDYRADLAAKLIAVGSLF